MPESAATWVRRRVKQSLGGYSMTGNYAVFDPRVSDGAYRLLHMLRLLAWRASELEVTTAVLADLCGCRATKIDRLAAELVDAGYLAKRRVGRAGTVWTLLPPTDGAISLINDAMAAAVNRADFGMRTTNDQSSGRLVGHRKPTVRPGLADRLATSKTIEQDEIDRRPTATETPPPPGGGAETAPSRVAEPAPQVLAVALVPVLVSRLVENSWAATGPLASARNTEVVRPEELLPWLREGVAWYDILAAWEEWVQHLAARATADGERWMWQRPPWVEFAEWWLAGGHRSDPTDHERIPWEELGDLKRAAARAQRTNRQPGFDLSAIEGVRIPVSLMRRLTLFTTGVLAVMLDVTDHGTDAGPLGDVDHRVLTTATAILSRRLGQGRAESVLPVVNGVDELFDRGVWVSPVAPERRAPDQARCWNTSDYHQAKHDLAERSGGACRDCMDQVDLGCSAEHRRGRDGWREDAAIIDADELVCSRCLCDTVLEVLHAGGAVDCEED